VGVASSDDEYDVDEFSAAASAGSPKLQDRLQVNALGYAGSTGFLGKASTVRWLEEVNEKVLEIRISTVWAFEKRLFLLTRLVSLQFLYFPISAALDESRTRS
jgi:hypothetical protein